MVPWKNILLFIDIAGSISTFVSDNVVEMLYTTFLFSVLSSSADKGSYWVGTSSDKIWFLSNSYIFVA